MAQGPVLIIAEPGSTHEGNLDRMLALIQVAAQAGADICKFAWVSDPVKLAKRRHVEDWIRYKPIAFPAVWHVKLWTACQEAGIEYACSVYLREDLQIISFFVERFKISSFETTDRAFIRACESFGKPVIVSTGMQNADELTWLLRRRKKNPNVKLLHCVSAYPAPTNELNLATIHRYGLDGFSDHSGQIHTGGLAVAAGARIIEMHFRLNDTDAQNPDFPHSLPESAFAEYIKRVRWAEMVIGNGVKKCQPSEEAMRKYRVGEKRDG